MDPKRQVSIAAKTPILVGRLDAPSTNTATPLPAAISTTAPVTTADRLVVSGVRDNVVIMPYMDDAESSVIFYVYGHMKIKVGTDTPSYTTSKLIQYTGSVGVDGVAGTAITDDFKFVDAWSSPDPENILTHEIVTNTTAAAYILIWGLGPFSYLSIEADCGGSGWNAFAETF